MCDQKKNTTVFDLLKRLDALESRFKTLKDILNFEEASSYLSLSKSYLYRLTSTLTIPHYKPNGKIIYFKREDLDKWLLRNRVLSQSEIDMQESNALLSNHKGGSNV